VRNLPANSTSGSVVQKLISPKDLSVKILHCSVVHIVNEKSCVVVTLPSVEEAEALCIHWNNFMFKDRTVLKAHIHPFSSWKRIE